MTDQSETPAKPKVRACIVLMTSIDNCLVFGKTTASLKPGRRVEATLIGGKAEDESAIEAAWREFIEEAGKQAADAVKLHFKQVGEVTVEANGWTYVAFIFVPMDPRWGDGQHLKGLLFESLMKLAEERAQEGLSPLGELYGFCAYPIDQLVEKELRDYGRYPLDEKTNLVKYYDPLVLAVAKACREL